MESLSEKIKSFLEIQPGYGYGYNSSIINGLGYSSGYCSSSGIGIGSGEGGGSGSIYGYGYCYYLGSGTGTGTGYGEGEGSGAGDCTPHGYGYGYGDGCGDGIRRYNGREIYLIDGVQTAITSIVKNVAKGYILHSDMTTSPCYIVKGNNKFAHGETLKKAVEDLQNKIFEGMDVDTAIDLFLKNFNDIDKKYPAREFYVWHNRLTGSCEMGRKQFIKNGGYDLENDKFTVKEFIEITENAYGGNIVKQLKEKIERKL